MDLTRKQLTNIDPKVNQFGGPANAFAVADGEAVERPNIQDHIIRVGINYRFGPTGLVAY